MYNKIENMVNFSDIYYKLKDIYNKHPAIACKKGVIHIGAHRCEEQKYYNDYPKTLWIDGNDDLCKEYPQIVNAIISDKDDEEVSFIITNNDAMSSSILELKEHLVEHPTCLESTRITKKTITLDSLIEKQNFSHDDFDLLVMDIQGAELHALKGSTKVLPHINAIITEVNTKELYENCALLPDLDAFLSNEGFIRIYTPVTKFGWGDALYIRRCISVNIEGGLSNRLFQMAFLYSIAKQTKSIPVLYTNKIHSHDIHSKDKNKYSKFYNLFKIYEKYDQNLIENIWEESNNICVYTDYSELLKYKPLVMFYGYFQSEKFFINYNVEIKNIFKNILNSYFEDLTIPENNYCFIHIRGRDYINDPLHHLITNNYYLQAIKNIPENTEYIIFTDDETYAMTFDFIKNISYTINKDDDLLSMNKMIKCNGGNICANSTFSWWACYLSNSIHKIMPYPFLNNANFYDIYFNDISIINVH